MKSLTIASLILAATAVLNAGIIQTVVWAPDNNIDGAGTGTLGALTVTYSTVVAGNGGESFTTSWNSSLGTNTLAPYSSQTAGILGTTSGSSPELQTISFTGGTITNPLLLVNFAGDGGTMTFLGGDTVDMLQENNTTYSQPTSTFTNGGKSANDGFLAMILGTFGPDTPIELDYSTTLPFDSVGFTVGNSPVATPEPVTLTLSLGGIVAIAAAKRRWRNRYGLHD